MFLNINTDAVVQHTRTLEQLHKSALPVAIRGALNDTAYDVKKVTMPVEGKVFEQRSPTFLKATSRVEQARGFDVKTMRATVGFMPPASAKEKGGATSDLEEQEHGGRIGHRAFVPLASARAGNSWNRNVRAPNRLGAVRQKIVDSKDSAGSGGQQYIRAALHAGVDGLVIGNQVNSKGNKMLLRINSIVRSGDSTIVKSTALYAVKAGRTVHPKATHFMEKASITSERKMEGFYIVRAEQQIKRLTK